MCATCRLLLLGRIACMQCIDAVYCYKCSVVGVSVCLSCAEPVKAIKMTFAVWTWVNSRNHVLS